MSMALVCLGITRKLIILSAVELSVCMGVGGCGWSISSRIFCISTPFRAFMYKEPSWASDADDMTALIIDASL